MTFYRTHNLDLPWNIFWGRSDADILCQPQTLTRRMSLWGIIPHLKEKGCKPMYTHHVLFCTLPFSVQTGGSRYTLTFLSSVINSREVPKSQSNCKLSTQWWIISISCLEFIIFSIFSSQSCHYFTFFSGSSSQSLVTCLHTNHYFILSGGGGTGGNI